MHDDDLTVGAFDFTQFGKAEEKKEDVSSALAVPISLPDLEADAAVLPSVTQEEKTEDQEAEVHSSGSSVTLEELERRERELAEKAEGMIADAQVQAQMIIQRAEQEGEALHAQIYAQASEEGYQDGMQKAYEEHKARLDEETACFLVQVRDILQAYEEEKNALIDRNIDELKEIAIAIAEKVIQISLKTSDEIIKKMIVTATAKLKSKEWAKIYVSKQDSSLFVEGHSDILDAISHLSEHIKIVVMGDAAPGTCIIELPDQIIDASAGMQLENIRGILKGDGSYGGRENVS